MTTRRDFILNCTALALTAAVAPSAALASSSPAPSTTKEPAGLALFKQCLNQSFTLTTAQGTSLNLTLVRAENLEIKHAKPNQKDAKNEKFRLLFQGSAAGALSQDSYWVENAKTGRIFMFLTPIGQKDPVHTYYEAIFNRLPASQT